MYVNLAKNTSKTQSSQKKEIVISSLVNLMLKYRIIELEKDNEALCKQLDFQIESQKSEKINIPDYGIEVKREYENEDIKKIEDAVEAFSSSNIATKYNEARLKNRRLENLFVDESVKNKQLVDEYTKRSEADAAMNANLGVTMTRLETAEALLSQDQRGGVGQN